MGQITIQQVQPEKPSRRARFKRYLSQSNWITDAWSWFMVLAGKAAEPVLILSVLYSSAKLLPAIQPFLTPQLDAVVFIAQFIALDVGGLSLNKMADQVQETNPTGARNAKRLSYALVSIMIAGVILASLSGLMSKIPQVAGVIDTILLIARAVLAVLYSRVIHSLKKESDELPQHPQPQNAPHPQPDIHQLLTDQANEFEQRLTNQANEFERQLAAQKIDLEALKREITSEIAGQYEARFTSDMERGRAEMERRIVQLRISLASETRQNETRHETNVSPRLVPLPSRPVSPVPPRQEKPTTLLDQAQQTGQQESVSGPESANCKAAVYSLLAQESSLQPIEIARRINQPRTTVWRHWNKWHEEQAAREQSDQEGQVERDETAS